MALSYDRDFLVEFKDNNEEVTITVDTEMSHIHLVMIKLNISMNKVN